LLLVLELLSRNYRVCLSTHSPQVLEMVWALKRIRERKGGTKDVLDLFEMPPELRPELGRVARRALDKNSRVYYFDPSSGKVNDFAELNPASTKRFEANWGGLSKFSEQASEVVARLVANS